jgi:acyl-coenzyme A synthetase/AMP-(fatty) acid ligase
METIVERLFINAKKNPEKTAVVFENESINYRMLGKRTLQCFHLFKELGVSASDKIIIQGKYTTWFVACIFAAHLCNAVAIPIGNKPSEMAVLSLADRVAAKLVITDFHIDRENNILFTTLEECRKFDESFETIVYPPIDSIADIIFTTGTTGNSKGVELTHRNLLINVMVDTYEFEAKPYNVGITLVPINHAAPVWLLYLTIYHGATYIFIEGMNKIKLMFDYMDYYNVRSMYIPPASITALSRLSKDKLHDYADQMICVSTSSAPMQVFQQNYLREMLPKSILYFSYSSSENGIISVYRYHKDFRDITCCGRPCIGVDVRIVDDDYEEVPVGEPGRIIIKSAMNMKGYYQMPELNAEVFRDGWFLSNDMGYIDAEGFLYVLGRKDDIINIGGYKVYPSEIEVAALKIEGVSDCICFSDNDDITGQAAKLLIKKSSGCDKTVVDIKKQLAFFLDSYKIPRSIEFIDQIERTFNGKLDRKFYKDQN